MARRKRKSKFNMNEPIYKSLVCECGRIVERVSFDATGVTCSYCLLSKIPTPTIRQEKVSSGRPPGWHFMKVFVDKNGNVFHKGVEQPKLKGTLKPTKVEKKRQKRRSREEILAERHKKKQAAIRKAKGKKLGRPKKRGRPKGSKNKKK